MDDINLSQLLANATAFLTCGGILGGFFARYAKTIQANEIDKSIARFEKDRFHPALDEMKAQVKEIGNIVGRVENLQATATHQTKALSDLSVRVDQNAQQARDDLTGVANRLGDQITATNRAQTELLVNAINRTTKS